MRKMLAKRDNWNPNVDGIKKERKAFKEEARSALCF